LSKDLQVEIDSQSGFFLFLGLRVWGLLGLGCFNPFAIGTNESSVASNLRHKIKEVAVSIRAVGGKSLVAVVQVRSGSMKTLDRELGEIEIGGS
jgi:hypothetical protein